MVLVPQQPFLYGALDRSMGHKRRFEREPLEQMLTGAGFEVAARIQPEQGRYAAVVDLQQAARQQADQQAHAESSSTKPCGCGGGSIRSCRGPGCRWWWWRVKPAAAGLQRREVEQCGASCSPSKQCAPCPGFRCSGSLIKRDIPTPIDLLRRAKFCSVSRKSACAAPIASWRPFISAILLPASRFLVLGHEARGRVIADRQRRHVLACGRLRRPDDPAWLLAALRCCARRRSDLCVSGNYRERGIFGLHGYFCEMAVDRRAGSCRWSRSGWRNSRSWWSRLSVVEKAI